MAKFGFDEVDNYASENRGSFFVLREDKETAQVRFLYTTVDDIVGYSVYRVKVGDKDRYVNAIRAYNDPIENDPFAEAGLVAKPRLFVPVYNIDAKEVQVWERGKTYFARLASLAQRYNPLYKEIIEIERNGKKNDMKTEYQMYPIESTDFDLSSIEIPNPLGTIILDKTYEEMKYYIEHGQFPETVQKVAEQRTTARAEEPTVVRRTPEATNRRAF